MLNSKNSETSQTVASHYDDLDAFYRAIWGTHVHHGLWIKSGNSVEEATENLIRLVIKHGKISPGMKVCDVGCGYGGTSRYLAKNIQAQVTSLTVSKAQYDFIQHTDPQSENPVYLLEDWLSNSIPSTSMDTVIAIESSEHMVDFKKFFEESARVLKPDGQLIICAWLSRDNPSRMEQKHLLQPICTEGRMRLATQGEYLKSLFSAGFELEYFEDLTLKVKKTWTVCASRFMAKLFSDRTVLRFLLKSPSQNKDFAKTLFRIRLAYELKSMSYGFFVARKKEAAL